MQDDQPRPDRDAALDAAVDAVLPSLTGVSDEATAASLRRTRIALAKATPQRQGADIWRWSMVGATAALIVAVGWLAFAPYRAADPERSARAVPPAALLDGRPIAFATTSRAPAPEAVRLSIGTAARPARRPDPLLALMNAVQAIPDEAWDRGVALAQAPVAVTQVPLEPIAIAPLETPPITDAPAESVAPGEP
jgi:hypothetical protein